MVKEQKKTSNTNSLLIEKKHLNFAAVIYEATNPTARETGNHLEI